MEAKRTCGSCQLCCSLVPVREIGKSAGQRCRYQRFGKGCSIYAKRPRACQLWSCMWLLGAPLRRPDRSHYVVDVVVDTIACTENDGSVHHISAAQVWCDPKHRYAFRDPELYAYLLTLPTEGFAIVRWDQQTGLALIPPHHTQEKTWIESHSNYVEQLPGETHAPDDGRESSLPPDDPAPALRE